ncbi:exodeoxyribonuclease V subunit gamma [Thalassomonas haliotis]|uniref:RecBCD enzyme subunit RecC n=1 Tax=Thalassomonas haliotis TaxID=485448 RepID=A0ABY7VK32_9GAMM|nr:exodeoxyribonuclease V subunit gamma [Thalassomonas haliotis]WDE14105.1 exodeoxyribonuclease V subunit gamma [Thalassomonas haliotis]
MIYLYPANKMENLLVLLDKIQQISPLAVFSQEIIVVQNPGMQHWLNLSLAKQRGISMNIRYVLPAQFLWKLMRSVASDDEVPDQSPYSREVLTWRICALLGSDKVVNNPEFDQPSRYWQGETSAERASLKRYQLATQLADLYEQYLIFRPQWIDAWQRRESIFHGEEDTRAQLSGLDDIEKWQGLLWQLLIEELPYNPVTLLQDAIAGLSKKKAELPKRIVFFGINAMAPMWLDFINALSQHIEIHFFHLNPCFSYWGDIQSEKQAMKAITSWVDGCDDIRSIVGNPLLASLGQQGREFMALLHNYSLVNIDVFEHAGNTDSEQFPESVLAQLQNDILTLTDARQAPKKAKDDSLIITSCHSALREVQGLHDWLLHQFNADSELTPKDILVMCPQIESYAPYVNAVFTRGWQDIDDKIPPLPCSIADRSSKDAEPLIAAFIDLLNLPDSRFQVSSLLSLLRLPAMQQKFSLSFEDIDKITLWVEQAAIHWGLDRQHKASVLGLEQGNNSFTWQQGLSRLMTGFAYGDSEVIHQESLLLPVVEGGDGRLLGQLMLIIEQLQSFSHSLSTPRAAGDWQSYLQQMLEQLFVLSGDHNFELIYHGIESLVEYCSHALYRQDITLSVVRDFLNSHFSMPDPGRQFMVGQVTFCSMIPMRSIPFKIIAVLGLNDGEFPRQRQPLGFDLLAMTAAKPGDRSRRGDDRYLFLEAIISARQALYLSYQGRNIKTNAPREASLVLKELIEYLELGYGWQVNESGGDIRQLPMQPFSPDNYLGSYPGFDEKWLKLGSCVDTGQENSSEPLLIPQTTAVVDGQGLPGNVEEKPAQLNVGELIAFYQHPVRQFARHQLNLYFEQISIELEDAEPFTADRLQSYQLREQLLDCYLMAGDDGQEQSGQAQADTDSQVQQVLSAARLGGKFPDLPTTRELFEKWRDDSEQFSRVILAQGGANPKPVFCQLNFSLADGTGISINCQLPVQGRQLAFYRSSSAKAKDFFTLYLHQLMLQVWQNQLAGEQIAIQEHEQVLLTQVEASCGFYFDTKSQKVSQYRFKAIPEPQKQLEQLLSTFFSGQSQALLVNGDLAEHYFKVTGRGKRFSQQDFEKYWSDDNAIRPMSADPYMHYFWPACPNLSEHLSTIEALYQPMYQVLEKVKL